jgi:enamine deaminase RidA (YjgF/YER057c/UK114 family)
MQVVIGMATPSRHDCTDYRGFEAFCVTLRVQICRTEENMQRILVSNGNPMEETVGFSRAVRVGPYISVGGTAPVDEEGQTVGIGDARKQAERCFEIVDQALKQAGSGWRDVVRTRLILTDIENWREVIEARKPYCLASRPVDTIMQVTRFVNPDWLVEIEVDAIVAG